MQGLLFDGEFLECITVDHEFIAAFVQFAGCDVECFFRFDLPGKHYPAAPVFDFVVATGSIISCNTDAAISATVIYKSIALRAYQGRAGERQY